MYVFNVVDASDTDKTVAGPFDSGAEAGAKASELNEQYRGAGKDRRVRVLKEEQEPEKMVPALWHKLRRRTGPNPEPSLVDGSSRTTVEDFRESDSHRVYMVPEDGINWRETVYRRIRTQQAAPFTDETWYRDSEYAALHYPHADPDNREHVRFVPSEQAGQQGPRYKSMSPGRYLQTYFGNQLSDEQIQKYALAHATEHKIPELQVTQDADEIERVYIDGPRSCMSYTPGRYDSYIHPTRVYAGPDLALAYIENKDGKPSARAVVWPEKKRVSRIYGDNERMKAALEEAGYDLYNDNMNGARLPKIEDGPGGYVMPYIDGALRVREERDWFVIDSSGPIHADSEWGRIQPDAVDCESCGDRVEERETSTVDGHTWCRYCVDCYTVECDDCYRIVRQDASVETPDGWFLCDECAARCDRCDEHYPEGDMKEAPDADAIEGYTPDLCPDCYEKEIEEYRGKARRTGLPLHVVIPDTPAQAEQLDAFQSNEPDGIPPWYNSDCGCADCEGWRQQYSMTLAC